MNPIIFLVLKIVNFNCLVVLLFLSIQASSLNPKFEACEPKSCGFGPNISHPFWISAVQESYCGFTEFEITCNNNFPSRKISDDEYFIKNIFYTNRSLLVAAVGGYEYDNNTCSVPQQKITVDQTPFTISPGNVNLTFLYSCSTQPTEPGITYPITCASNDTLFSFATFHLEALESQGNFSLESCHYSVNTLLYINNDDTGTNVSKNYTQLLEVGFFLNWAAYNCSPCQLSGGRCAWYNSEFMCLCPDGSHGIVSCHNGFHKLSIVKVIIGSLSVGVGFLCASIFCYVRRKSHVFLTSFLKSETQNNRDIETFMRNYGSLIPTRYTYADVKKITNLFKEKLGQGGFGTVYKGKLLDGRLVAVKMLNETKGNGEEFINEVASISRTSHVNVVSLLGFCLERHKRALIYEFMPNGSLEQFIGSENHQNTGQHLDWEKFYQIAIGVARGLEYLHRGCNTRIVHFDIKPHNILLDKDFFPKISDFGLAKLCTKERSILSLLEARGTIGYIAPEVFSRNFGAVSHKSDVYSYGMVLLEMVGEKSKDDSVASDASEKYFPYWVYKHVELNKFGYLGVSAVKDTEIIRKMAIVGLWCIQTNPSDRPSMSEVIDMFKKNTEILEVPPKPFLFSPTKSASDSCTKLSMFNIPSSSNSL